MTTPYEVSAGIGFIVLFTLPALFVTSLVVRAIWLAWRPAQLRAQLVDPEHGAPMLAGWLLTLWLGAILLGVAAYGATHLLATLTEFRPMVIGFVQPVFSVASALLVLACSRPAALGFARIASAIDRRWRARGHSTLLRPTNVIAVVGVLATLTLWVVWEWVNPQLGHLDISPARAPVIGVLAALATHRFARRRVWITRMLTAVATAAIVLALVTWRTRPAVTLAIWGDMPVAGLLIDAAFDLDAIRDGISLDAFRPTGQPGASHPDIVLITIDTVRADHTPPYGGRAEMPFLARLAERGAVFEWAFAPSNVTRRSIPSMMTGIQPDRVRGRVVGWALRIDPRHVMVAERLRAAGYETAGFMCCEGFWGEKARTGLSRGLEHLEIERSGAKLAGLAREWVEQREKLPNRRPLFLWMHVLEPHNWSNGGSEPADLETRRRMYDRSLTASDKMLADVVSAFSKRTPEAAPIVIVTADHGEALGDHGEPNHSTDLYNSQIRVPFVVVGPGIRNGNLVETVSLTDLTATLVELAGFAPPITDGRSLAPLLTGKRDADDRLGIAFSAMIKDRSNPGGLTSLVAGAWKLIAHRGKVELYNIKDDPGENHDLATKHPDKVQELRTLLEARENLTRSPFEE
jgi:arylsulfatase A-like enzyme